MEYADRMRGLIARLTPANYDVAVEIASVPERIRGYGHIKRRHLAEVEPKQAETPVQRKRKVAAKTRASQPMRFAQQQRYGFFGTNTW